MTHLDEYSDLGGTVDKVCGSVSKEEGKISLDRFKKFESLYDNYIYEYQELKKYHEHLLKAVSYTHLTLPTNSRV